MSIDPQLKFIRRPDVIASQLGDTESVFLDVEQGAYYGTENVGHVIWSALEQPQSLDDLVQRVCAEYTDTTPEECGPDLAAFLADLLAAGFIMADTPEGASQG